MCRVKSVQDNSYLVTTTLHTRLERPGVMCGQVEHNSLLMGGRILSLLLWSHCNCVHINHWHIKGTICHLVDCAEAGSINGLVVITYEAPKPMFTSRIWVNALSLMWCDTAWPGGKTMCLIFYLFFLNQLKGRTMIRFYDMWITVDWK